jgi:ATP-dependent Lon protease
MLFLCTANMTDTIPGPLLDRMEVVRLSGYVTDEKVQILKQYIYPTARAAVGLKPEHMVRSSLPPSAARQPAACASRRTASDAARLARPRLRRASRARSLDPQELGDDASLKLIRWYCREAGVRSLQKHVDKICRKIALKVVKGGDALALPLRIDASNLEDYVGKPIWHTDRIYGDSTPPGVVMGLAWTSMGGSVLYIETVQLSPPDEPVADAPQQPDDDGAAAGAPKARPRGGASLLTTGKLGDVMMESSKLSHTLARRFARSVDPANSFLDCTALHMHVPEGSTPKDGPSAGVAMVTSLLSLALDRPVRPYLAMTGEVSLTGLVLPIGGVKEKVIAAQRAGVKHIILPRSNQRDFAELTENLRDGLEAHFVATYDDVYKVAFPEASAS